MITFDKIGQALRAKKIINRAKDLSDTFTQFLELSPDHSDICLLRKLSRAVKMIKESKYFKFFGIKRREPFKTQDSLPLSKNTINKLLKPHITSLIPTPPHPLTSKISHLPHPPSSSKVSLFMPKPSRESQAWLSRLDSFMTDQEFSQEEGKAWKRKEMLRKKFGLKG